MLSLLWIAPRGSPLSAIAACVALATMLAFDVAGGVGDASMGELRLGIALASRGPGDLERRLDVLSDSVGGASDRPSDSGQDEGRRSQQESERERRAIAARFITLYKYNRLAYLGPLFGAHTRSSWAEGMMAAVRMARADDQQCIRLRDLFAEAQPESGLTVSRGAGEPAMDGLAGVYGLEAARLEQLQGTLPLPTQGGVIDTFGGKARSSSQEFLYSKGIIIRAPKGQPVRAILEGRVVFADWFKDYGKVIIIDHGGRFYSLAAHVDELLKKPGDRVERGERIATVGDTGSTNGPKLYFELRTHGQPVNPMEWLAVRESMKE